MVANNNNNNNNNNNVPFTKQKIIVPILTHYPHGERGVRFLSPIISMADVRYTGTSTCVFVAAALVGMD